MPSRTIAVGDIHGCSKALDAILDAIGPNPEDTIVTLGDCIKRRSDSRGIIERLIDLEGRCRLVPILGNHDQMLLDVRSGKYPIYWLLDIGGTTTLGSYGPGRDGSLIPDEHFEFLEGCQDLHETDTHNFVHASYFPDIPMAEQPVGMLRWGSLGDTTPGPHESGKTVIVGHSSQKTGTILDQGNSNASTRSPTAAAGSRPWKWRSARSGRRIRRGGCGGGETCRPTSQDIGKRHTERHLEVLQEGSASTPASPGGGSDTQACWESPSVGSLSPGSSQSAKAKISPAGSVAISISEYQRAYALSSTTPLADTNDPAGWFVLRV